MHRYLFLVILKPFSTSNMPIMLLVVNVWTKSTSLVNKVEWLRSLSDLFVICFCQLFWTGQCTIFNRWFMNSKNSHFQIDANLKTFLMKIVCMRIEKHFYINGFPLSLALRQTFKATWKWPITLLSFWSFPTIIM